MTWEAKCPVCHGDTFYLTNGSSGQLHVNCSNLDCVAYIGEIPPDHILLAPTVEPH